MILNAIKAVTVTGLLLAATACSADSTTDAAPTPSLRPATSGPTLGPKISEAYRFQDTVAKVRTVFAGLNKLDPVAGPANKVNAALGLSATSPAMFADYTPVEGDGLDVCLEADNNTYFTFQWLPQSPGLPLIMMGDGDCSYDAENAKIVSDLETGKWRTGADLMGPYTDVNSVMSDGTLD